MKIVYCILGALIIVLIVFMGGCEYGVNKTLNKEYKASIETNSKNNGFNNEATKIDYDFFDFPVPCK